MIGLKEGDQSPSIPPLGKTILRVKKFATEPEETLGFTKWKVSLHDGTFVGRAGWSP